MLVYQMTIFHTKFCVHYPAQIIYPGMLYAQWNSSPLTPSACTSHCTAHTTHSCHPAAHLNAVVADPSTYNLTSLPTFTDDPNLATNAATIARASTAMYESHNKTNRPSSKFGQHLPLVLVNHYQIQHMCVDCIWQRLSSSNIMSLHEHCLPWQ